jgi:hypothetical protein
MTKVLQAKIYYKRKEGVTTYRDKTLFDGYPDCWQFINPIAAVWPNEFEKQEFTSEKGPYQIWLLKLTDADYDIALADPQCSPLSEAEATAIAADLDPDFEELEEITNEAVVKRLTIKAMQGKSLSEAEEGALDPHNDELKGINKKKSFLNKHALSW